MKVGMLRFFVVLAMVLVSASALEARVLKGVVVSSDDHTPVPFASVSVVGTSVGKLADEAGRFSLSTTSQRPVLKVSALGFETTEQRVDVSGRTDTIVVQLNPVGIAVSEVVVKPRKEKYSKRNNPAVDLSRRIADNRDRNNPRRNAYFNFDRYDRYSIGFNDVRSGGLDNLFTSRFKFLTDYIDTCDITGKPVLVMSVRESSSHHHYRHDPEKEVTLITGTSQVGVDDFLDQENLRVFLDDLLGDVDIFKNDIPLMRNRFVSPFSPLAPDFYKFYLTDTVLIEGRPHTELTFVPRNALTFGFTGKIYVDTYDPSTFVRRVSLNVPKAINLNFVDRLYINQDYKRMPDSTIVKTSEDIAGELQLFPGLPGIYVRKHTMYGRQNFERPDDEMVLFDRVGSNFVDDNASVRDSTFWAGVRYQPLGKKESQVGQMVKRLRADKFYYWADKVLKIAVMGYISTGKKSLFDIGPMNTIFSHNQLEGYRFRVGGITTANLSPRWFARGYAAYGTKDRKMKYNAEVEYSFVDKKYHSREFPVQSIRASYGYDVDMLGQHLTFANPDNMFLSLRRKKDYEMTYRRLAKLEYTLELQNHFSVVAALQTSRQYSTEYMMFIDVDGQNRRHYDLTSLKVQLRYAPGEKFYQSKSHRYPISLDAPIVCLTHEIGPRRWFGNQFGINATELSVQKRFWLSAFGYIDAIVKGGHLWNAVPYPNLMLPSANLSYTIQPESYSLMNPMEFATDSYASVDLTYWLNGAILNYIPLIKKMKLREVVQFKSLWGHLSKRNDPAYNTDLYPFPAICRVHRMTSTPYMELSAGLDNIFRILRVDYVWRLSYRNNPDIDKQGLRVALHFTF